MGIDTNDYESTIIIIIVCFSFGLSNQKYYAPDGSLYEGVGIPADIEMPFDGDSFASGRDTVLESTLALATTGR